MLKARRLINKKKIKKNDNDSYNLDLDSDEF